MARTGTPTGAVGCFLCGEPVEEYREYMERLGYEDPVCDSCIDHILLMVYHNQPPPRGPDERD